MEHRHQRIPPVGQQLGAAALVRCRAGHNQDRAGAIAFAHVDHVEECLQRVMGIVALGTHEDVAGSAKQRGGPGFVTQSDRVGFQFGAGKLHPFAGFRQ